MWIKLGMPESICNVVPPLKMRIFKNRWGLHRWKGSREGVPGSRNSVSKKHRDVEVCLFKEWTKYTQTQSYRFI